MSYDQEDSLEERALELVTLDAAELELVNGAWGWSDLKEAAKGGFGLRTLYREGVKTVRSRLPMGHLLIGVARFPLRNSLAPPPEAQIAGRIIHMSKPKSR